jgi:hypothetical protein
MSFGIRVHSRDSRAITRIGCGSAAPAFVLFVLFVVPFFPAFPAVAAHDGSVAAICGSS